MKTFEDQVLYLHRELLRAAAPGARRLHRPGTIRERRVLRRLIRARGCGVVLAVVWWAMHDWSCWMELPRLDHRLARWFDQMVELRARDLARVEVAA